MMNFDQELAQQFVNSMIQNWYDSYYEHDFIAVCNVTSEKWMAKMYS
uniref:Uncharacterized protein n=1 Tax=Arundo donax TaxID=35708 RepID=A0A0A9BJT2_ARUDO